LTFPYPQKNPNGLYEERKAYDSRAWGSGEVVKAQLREADEARVRQVRDNGEAGVKSPTLTYSQIHEERTAAAPGNFPVDPNMRF
jgi:hypothetical protein